MTDDISYIESTIRSAVEQGNAILIDLFIKSIGRHPLFQVYVDTETGITAGQLSELNRKISKSLEEHQLVSGAYRLDVSSPGLDRPLAYLWQYKRNIGRKLEIQYDENTVQRTIVGTLEEVRNDAVAVRLKKETVTIPFTSIKKSIVQVTFA